MKNLKMAGNDNKLLLQFLESGIYKFPASNTFFIDPVRLLNRNYTNFRVSPCSYYSRFFNLSSSIEEQNLEEKHDGFLVTTNCGKRKRYRKNKTKQKCYSLNEKELLADKRHQEIRGLLVNAHEELVRDKELLDVICELKYENEGWERCVEYDCGEVKERENFSLIELGKVWQASFYEIALYFTQDNEEVGDNGGSLDIKHDDIRLFPIFNTLVSNETDNHMVADFQTTRYILPKKSCFCMSELEQIHSIVPADTECGYNFIMIDPPWENRSAYQKSKYPTLPNRHFLSIPIKKIAHSSGALVALWVTNREKLRNFVEDELFPAWGVKFAATLYWLKVKANGSLICDLNLFHHRPYECLLLGYTGGEVMTMEKALKDQIVMSIPGDYSRKPPLGDLLMQYVPGPRPAHCIELFAREMMSGWTSWGNEPLHFQEMRYFSRKITGKCTN